MSEPSPTASHEAMAAEIIERLERQVATVVLGKSDVIRQAVEGLATVDRERRVDVFAREFNS